MGDLASQFALPQQSNLAIVTGSSRGIGAGITWELARRGANTTASVLPKSLGLRSANSLISRPHGPARPTCQRPRAPRRSFQSSSLTLASDDFQIHILVNNAATEMVSNMQSVTLEDYNKVFNLNVRGLMLMTQAVVPYLAPKGRIINLSSVGARSGFKDVSIYSASKAAVESFTRTWASELGGDGTTVNAVAPGPVPSDMLDNIPKEIVDMQKTTTPIEQRLGTTEEIASILGWLAGPDASWVSGQVICASGGWSMY
ncbi:Short-chain dehydrogenase/reductase SDR [Penicillium atrosanguineum]|uniref:Short-chain dehydrogenase/reductase SDR n=1 Tax=Penicillium atrosanguineum TaxID=1132637 RepID=A0A9W9U3F1_9EURO|nr:Short-chain dehydrogenase/reductase SDR [Penicillium atrosanguineum]KAJ5311034.1 Short-chain dehydrogenase/reductase SDR [Penicillium atrosanguineum]